MPIRIKSFRFTVYSILTVDVTYFAIWSFQRKQTTVLNGSIDSAKWFYKLGTAVTIAPMAEPRTTFGCTTFLVRRVLFM